MASATTLTLQEFHSRFSSEKGYEYWFGEVVRKSVPAWLHSILQALLVKVFTQIRLDEEVWPEMERRANRQ